MNWPRSLHPHSCLTPRAHREIAQVQLSARAAPAPVGPMRPLNALQPMQSRASAVRMSTELTSGLCWDVQD